MSTADNKALVTKFWEAFSASKFDDALAMLSDDATWWVAGTTALSGKYTKPEFAALLGNVTGSEYTGDTGGGGRPSLGRFGARRADVSVVADPLQRQGRRRR